jgi:hypothetical protein
MSDFERPSESKTLRKLGRHSRSCINSDRYTPRVDFSSSSPLALKKKDNTRWFFILLRASPQKNFINVDFPVPAFPLIQRNPRCLSSFSIFIQSWYCRFSRIHVQVFAWAVLIVVCRALICANLSDSIKICLFFLLSDKRIFS